MPSQNYNFGGNAPDRTTGSGDGFFYTDGIAIPQGRIVANGQGPIRVHSIAGYISGVSSPANVSIAFGGASTGTFGVGQSGSAQATGPRGMTGWVANGGSVRVQYNLDRQCYIGRTTDGSKSVIGQNQSFGGFSLAGFFSYVEGPSDPQGVSAAAAGAGQATISWSGPADDGGSAILGYTVAYTQDSSFASGVAYVDAGNVPSTTISFLEAGKVYYFRVAATNDVTEHFSTKGFYSGTVSALIATVPGAPTNLSASSGVTEAYLSWVAPSNNGGQAISNYVVEYSTNASFASSFTATMAGTSTTIGGLTNGATYYFRVRATNSVGTGANSPTASAYIANAPGAPTSFALNLSDMGAHLTWAAPASDGGAPVLDYAVNYGTDPAFGTFSTASTTATFLSLGSLAPNTLYYFRVRARNTVGQGTVSGTASGTTPVRDALDLVRGASVGVGGLHISLRSNGGAVPTITLGYVPFGASPAFVGIATVPTGAGGLAIGGGSLNIALAADAAGNLYVIGASNENYNGIRTYRYAKTGATSWAAATMLTQSLPVAQAPLSQFAAVTVNLGVFVLMRRAGALTAGNLSYALLDTDNLARGTGTLFRSYEVDPAWLSTPPNAAAPNSGTLDVGHLTPGVDRLVIAANGFAVVDVAASGVVSGVSKSAAGTSLASSWSRVIGVNSGAFALLSVSGGAITWKFYGTNGALLGQGSYAGANALGGAFDSEWDAYYDRVTDAITVYYLADDSSLKLESFDISPTTYAASGLAVLTTVLGAGANTRIRVPSGDIDERRVMIEAANLNGGVVNTVGYAEGSGNRSPTSPIIVDEIGYDASTARAFNWTFGDPNPLDTQTAYDFEVQRVSDSVNVHTSGKVASAAGTRTLAANTLANGIGYRWRVRAYDALSVAGAWSVYDAFTTSALGTLTITSPATDNEAGLITSSITVAWSYAQADGYVQTQRRVRVLNTATGGVLSDTGMQASTATNYMVTGLASDVQATIEVSVVTNAPGAPVVTTTRKVTPSFSKPMTPLSFATLGESFVAINIINPAPAGSRPEVAYNDIERRDTGGTAFVYVGRAARNGTYYDHAVASGASYDYRVKGVTL